MTNHLLEIPPADLHVATLLIHAAHKLLGRAGAVVCSLLLGCGLRLGRLGRLSGGAAATKEPTQGVTDYVADGRTDCDTTVNSALVKGSFGLARLSFPPAKPVFSPPFFS